MRVLQVARVVPRENTVLKVLKVVKLVIRKSKTQETDLNRVKQHDIKFAARYFTEALQSPYSKTNFRNTRSPRFTPVAR